MKLNIAPCTIRYTDYGSHLEDVRGIVWIDSHGYPMKGGFERGKTVAEKQADMSEFVGLLDGNGEPFELVVHPHIMQTVDMNPHGLV